MLNRHPATKPATHYHRTTLFVTIYRWMKRKGQKAGRHCRPASCVLKVDCICCQAYPGLKSFPGQATSIPSADATWISNILHIPACFLHILPVPIVLPSPAAESLFQHPIRVLGNIHSKFSRFQPPSLSLALLASARCGSVVAASHPYAARLPAR